MWRVLVALLLFIGTANAETLTNGFGPGSGYNATSGNTPRALVDRALDQINPLDFSVVADGVTPIGALFNALITAQGAAHPYRVPPGTYLIDQSVLMPSNFQMVCAGSATVFKAAAGMTAPMFVNNNQGSGNANISITNCAFDGNKANQVLNNEVDAIKCYSCGNLHLRDISISNTEGHGVHLNNGGTVTGQVVDNLQCDGVGTYPTNTYGSCLAVTAGTGTKISHLRAYNTAKAGLRFSGSGFSSATSSVSATAMAASSRLPAPSPT